MISAAGWRDSFRGEEALVDRLRGKENVEFVLNAVITELKGDSELSGITVEQDGVQREIPVSGLFVAIGHEPDLAAFADFLDRDAQGYAASDEGCLTKTEGFFVAGDCRRKKRKSARSRRPPPTAPSPPSLPAPGWTGK